jgi:hypothetical protein
MTPELLSQYHADIGQAAVFGLAVAGVTKFLLNLGRWLWMRFYSWGLTS